MMIVLECLGCGKKIGLPREVAIDVPRHVVKITQSMCDDCWNGDFDTETWYDADGNEVSQRADTTKKSRDD